MNKKKITLIFCLLFGFLFFYSSPSLKLGEMKNVSARKKNNTPVEMVELSRILKNHSYTSEYKEGVFDCSDMSILLERFLEEKGYHSKVASSPVEMHAWVVVEVEGEWVKIETTCYPLKSLGCISTIEESPPFTYYMERFVTFSGEKIVENG